MNVDQRIEHRTRADILNLLSDDEIGFVSSAEEAQIPEGDEYIDLEHLERGVLTAEAATPGKDALPHTAVSDETWEKIVTVLETPTAGAQFGA